MNSLGEGSKSTNAFDRLVVLIYHSIKYIEATKYQRLPKPLVCFIMFVAVLWDKNIYTFDFDLLSFLQSLINMHIYDNTLYANLEDLNA